MEQSAIRFYYRNRKCLLCGTNWGFRTDYVSFLKGLNRISNANSRSHNHFCNGNSAVPSVCIDDVHVNVNKILLCRIYYVRKNTN
jgi:hypothetical protein